MNNNNYTMGNYNSVNTLLGNNLPMQSGMLSLVMGPMYAGKTTYLIDLYEKNIKFGKKVIVLTHSSEIRYSIENLSTHNKKSITCLKHASIKEFLQKNTDEISNANVIMVDESQFFEDLMEVLYMVNTLCKEVYVFGLDGDFKRNKFGNILDLIPHCDDVKKLKAKCNRCENDAIFSHRITNNSKQVLVGSSDDYQALCRLCYNNAISSMCNYSCIY